MLKSSKQLDLLDRYAGTPGLVEEHREAFLRLGSLLTEKERLENFLGESRDRMDVIQHEQSLLRELDPDPDDYRQLLQEEKSLSEAIDKADILAEASGILEGEQGIIPRLASLQRKIGSDSPDTAQLCELLDQARIALEESHGMMCRRLFQIEVAPARIEEIRARLDRYSRMMARFGGTFDALLQRNALLDTQLKDFTAAVERLAAIEGEAASLRGKVSASAAVLSRKRLEAADRFARLSRDEMKHLNMPWADFLIELVPIESGLPLEGRRIDRRGGETARFLFSANRGSNRLRWNRWPVAESFPGLHLRSPWCLPNGAALQRSFLTR
jgi:DNA repair protein RecN (Recombination protein N)